MSKGGTLCNRNDGKIMVTYVLKAINLPCNVLKKSGINYGPNPATRTASTITLT